MYVHSEILSPIIDPYIRDISYIQHFLSILAVIEFKTQLRIVQQVFKKFVISWSLLISTMCSIAIKPLLFMALHVHLKFFGARIRGPSNVVCSQIFQGLRYRDASLMKLKP